MKLSSGIKNLLNSFWGAYNYCVSFPHFEDPCIGMYLPFRALQQFFLKKASLGVAKRLAIPVPKFPIAPVRKKLGSMQAFQFIYFYSGAIVLLSSGSSPYALLLLCPQKVTAAFELHSQLQQTVWVTGKFNPLSALSPFLGNSAEGSCSHS